MTASKNFLKHLKQRRRLAIDIGFGALIAVLFVVVLSLVPQLYAKTIIPGVWVGNVPVGGKTVAEASTLVQAASDALADHGLTVSVNGKDVIVPIQQAVSSSDQTPPLVDVDADASVKGAFSYGHSHGIVRDTLEAWRAILTRKHVAPVLLTDEKVVKTALQDQFGAKDDPAVNAHLQYANGTYTVSAEKTGHGYQYQPALVSILKQWHELTPAHVTLTQGNVPPELSAVTVSTFSDDALAVVQRAPLTLTLTSGKTATLDAAVVGQGLDVVVGPHNKAQLAFTADKLQTFLANQKKSVDVPVQESRFQIANGKATEFQQGQTGQSLDIAATVAAMNATLLGQNATTVAAVIQTITPQSASNSATQLGITELVASGTTNFKNSPTNRRKNIARAVVLLNGLIIKPGEEFSLVKALQPITTANGFLPELVIKGNKTLPEVGGGLCQVGTTMFRVSLNAGVPILERTNHSYRVSYYEPPVGMDATIYDPKPDFRIRNDYASALLLQAHVDGDNLTFDFYGTKDDRVATSSAPILSNVTKPPAPLVIKTTDLPVGKTKLQEHAHNGGQATFTYTVVKDGKTTTQVFNSKYKAWRQVTLLGATAEDVAASQAGT